MWSRTNGAQGSTYSLSNLQTDSINATSLGKPFQGFLIQKTANTPPDDIVFTPEMILPSKDFSEPDRFYINLKQQNINIPIGGFCYDVKKFPSFFPDIQFDGPISIPDGANKVILRKDSFHESDSIKVRVDVSISATYTILLIDPSGIFESMPHIYLADNTVGTVHDLKASGYTFTSDPGEFTDRFEIRFEYA